MDKQFPHFQKYDNNEMKNRANQAATVNIRDILCEKLQNKFAKIRSPAIAYGETQHIVSFLSFHKFRQLRRSGEMFIFQHGK